MHRELASGLSCPVGFKNGTDGNVQIAIDAILSARGTRIRFLGAPEDGQSAILCTAGNTGLPPHPARRHAQTELRRRGRGRDCAALLEKSRPSRRVS